MVYVMLVTFLSVSILIDIISHRIGKVEGVRSSMSPWAWFIFLLFLFPIALPVYLINRRKLIERAKVYPTSPTGAGYFFGTIFVIVQILSFFAFFGNINEAAYTADAVNPFVEKYVEYTMIDQNGKKIVDSSTGTEKPFTLRDMLTIASTVAARMDSNGKDLRITLLNGKVIYITCNAKKNVCYLSSRF